jgi:uncharacterized protein (TIGR02099 family)
MRRRLKQTADFCRWSLYLAIVLSAVILLLCRLLITQLYFYQTQIESYLSESLLTYVVAEEARGVWDTIYPVIELDYLRVGPNQVDPGLEATFVRAVPNYLQSLRLQTAIWEELSIVDLTIDLNQRPDGSWAIGAFPRSSGSGSATAGQKLADMLFRSRSIDIQNLDMNYLFLDGRSFNLKFSEMKAENESNFHRISLKGQVDGAENGIEAVLELTGEDYQFRNMQGKAYAALSGADMSNLFAALLEGYVDTSVDLPVLVEGEMWFEISEGATLDMVGELMISDLFLREVEEEINFDTGVWGQRNEAGDWRFDLVDMNFALADQLINNIGLSLQTQGDGVRILSERIAMEDLTQQIQDLGLASEGLSQALTNLAPRGDITSASLLLLDDEQGYRWLVEGNLESSYTQSYGGVPRLENLSGHFFINEEGGEFLIESVDASVHFERLFQQKIFNRSLQGQVGWRLARDRGELHVYSDAIQSTNEYGAEGVTQFHLITPINRGDFYSDLTLISGMKNGSANLWPLYLPTLSGDSLRNWLEQSGVSGEVPEIGFIYRGFIREGSEYPKTVQLIGDLMEGELEFAPGWPPMREVKARFGLSDRRFYTHAPISQLEGVALVNSDVEINIAEESQLVSSTLLVGELNDIVNLTRYTPARASMGESLDGLIFSGHAEVSFSLDQPIAKQVPADQIYISARSSLSGIDLKIEPLDLSLDSISGLITYDEDGLNSDEISARFWDMPVLGSIKTDESTDIRLNSEVEMQSLSSWIGDPLMKQLQGGFQFESELSIPLDNSQPTRYWLRSDSVGISTDLPVPLKKVAENERPLELLASISPGGDSVMDIVWGEEFNFSVDFNEGGSVAAASFGIASDHPAKEVGKLVGNAALEDLDYLEWQPLFEGESTSDLPLQPQLNISSQSTWFSGQDIGPITSQIALNEKDIEITFYSQFSEGLFLFEKQNRTRPHVLLVDWLDIALIPGISDSDDDDSSGTDEKGSDFDPRKLPAMVVDIQLLRKAESEWGKWNFELQPHDLGLSVTNIYATFAGSTIEAGGSSQIDWGYNGEDHLTEMDLQLSLGDVGEIFELSGKSAAVSSESGSIDLNLGWLGKPWQPTLAQLSGTVNLTLNDGKFDAQAEGDELLKLIALFSIDNWGRRLKFDFSDLSEDGTGYDSFRGNFGVENGLVTTLSPVQISLTTGDLRFSGDMDLLENQVDAELIATLPVRNNLAWVTTAFMGVGAGAAVWLFGELFKDELDSMASVTYLVTGDIDSPDIDARSATEVQAPDPEEDS